MDPAVAQLEQRVSDTTSELHDFYVIFGLVVAVGFGASTYSWFTTTRRESGLAVAGESAAQMRASEAHAEFLTQSRLAIAGERASQGRATALHSESLSQFTQARDTLTLVNSTLALAESASRRAADAIEERAIQKSAELDAKAQELLDEVRHRDDRALVAEPGLRERLTALAEKIAGFRNTEFVLPVEIALTPACHFIAAMGAHLKSQFEEAFDSWAEVARTERADRHLRSAARYWIGYEHNNLGDFARASASFQLALDEIQAAESPSIAREYDIRRIMLETEFFNRGDSARIMRDLEHLLRLIDNESPNSEIDETRSKITVTLGNVCHVTGIELSDLSEQRRLFTRAIELFKPYEETRDWARFGLAEALYQIPERRDEAVELFRTRVRADAQKEFDQREEMRSKFRAKLAELIVCVRVPGLNHEIAVVADNVRDALAPLEERLTVYSLLQRRNVPKSTIRNEELPAILAGMDQ